MAAKKTRLGLIEDKDPLLYCAFPPLMPEAVDE